ncbi:metallophosphoesterase family protein [Pelagicoccus sp. NFK12]|uniref:Metallophosphoesterase family protein n=1 Tax=Pelagicoccus enzymogenes TaxID=2773457 RepID=A0A927IKA3_9BACT|nr:metallophosphoesterase [Pelagicoccus enzymogenes]MBD5782638.1 metallophosphoesterase family protein [Pelagicoccus enzymogenes]
MSAKIRIVSDLHVGHKASVIDRLDALAPLAEGVDWLILNGDTLELKYGDLDVAHYDAQREKQRFEQEIAKWDCKVSVITGNHDPEISELHSLTLLDGKVFVTHGDGLFPNIAPWSSNVDNLEKHASIIDPDATGITEQDLHDYLALHKQVTIRAHKDDKKYNPTLWGKLKIFLHQTWPPTTPFRILKAWSEVPDRAASLTERFGLAPKFIVVGHTHNPGIWTRGKQRVINLGSYFPWPGALCIEIEDKTLNVRRVRKRQNAIEIGRTVASFKL